MEKRRFNLRWKFRQLYQRLYYWLEWRFSDEHHDPWRCGSCGSTDLKRLIWAAPNNNYIFIAEDESINYRSVCRHCEDETLFVKHSELMADIGDWFENHLRTGLRRLCFRRGIRRSLQKAVGCPQCRRENRDMAHFD